MICHFVWLIDMDETGCFIGDSLKYLYSGSASPVAGGGSSEAGAP
jgi:hypothetical protein